MGTWIDTAAKRLAGAPGKRESGGLSGYNRRGFVGKTVRLAGGLVGAAVFGTAVRPNGASAEETGVRTHTCYTGCTQPPLTCSVCQGYHRRCDFCVCYICASNGALCSVSSCSDCHYDANCNYADFDERLSPSTLGSAAPVPGRSTHWW